MFVKPSDLQVKVGAELHLVENENPEVRLGGEGKAGRGDMGSDNLGPTRSRWLGTLTLFQYSFIEKIE